VPCSHPASLRTAAMTAKSSPGTHDRKLACADRLMPRMRPPYPCPPNRVGAHPAGRHNVPSSLTRANYKARGGSAAGPCDGARSGAAPSCAAPRQLIMFSTLANRRKRSPQALATPPDCQRRHFRSCASGIAAEPPCRSRRGHFPLVGRVLSRQLRRWGTLLVPSTSRSRRARRLVRHRTRPRAMLTPRAAVPGECQRAARGTCRSFAARSCFCCRHKAGTQTDGLHLVPKIDSADGAKT